MIRRIFFSSLLILSGILLPACRTVESSAAAGVSAVKKTAKFSVQAVTETTSAVLKVPAALLKK